MSTLVNDAAQPSDRAAHSISAQSLSGRERRPVPGRTRQQPSTAETSEKAKRSPKMETLVANVLPALDRMNGSAKHDARDAKKSHQDDWGDAMALAQDENWLNERILYPHNNTKERDEIMRALATKDWPREQLSKWLKVLAHKRGVTASQVRAERKNLRDSFRRSFAARELPSLVGNGAQGAAGFEFEASHDGAVKATQHNIRVALNRCPYVFSFDESTDRIFVESANGNIRECDDAIIKTIWLEIDRRFGIRPGIDLFFTLVEVVARENAFHPIREHVDNLEKEWDKVDRLDDWVVTYLGVEDTPLHRAYGQLMLIGAVRRVRQPGSKFDTMPVLDGPQGIGKSSAVRILAGRAEWFTDSLPLGADPKLTIERTRGVWFAEASELSGMKGSEVENIKNGLSRQEDTARLAYGRLPVSKPRSFIFVGTTNDRRFNRDFTGGRRFWPLPCTKIDLEGLREVRDQLIAEAAAREREWGRGNITLDPALWEAATIEQEKLLTTNKYLDALEPVFGGHMGKIAKGEVYKVAEVRNEGRHDSVLKEIGRAMKTLGWESTQARVDGHRTEVFARGSAEERGRTLVAYYDQTRRSWVLGDTKGIPAELSNGDGKIRIPAYTTGEIELVIDATEGAPTSVSGPEPVALPST